jgi:hypothetical protein
MIRIVGIQRNPDPEREFVLLQNQGGLRLTLRGHAILREDALEFRDCGTQNMVLLTDDVIIPPGVYVLLHTGHGVSRWARSRDGALMYVVYIGRDEAIWCDYHGPIHVLATQHTFTERRETLVAV